MIIIVIICNTVMKSLFKSNYKEKAYNLNCKTKWKKYYILNKCMK